MSLVEVYGERELAYGAWHRPESIGRYVEYTSAVEMSMVDVDVVLWCEYDEQTKEPLVYVETAKDVGQVYKTATVTQKQAEYAWVPALTVLYTTATTRNPADPGQLDISGFRVRRIYPEPRRRFTNYSPKDYAQTLLRLRDWSRRMIPMRRAWVRQRGIWSAPGKGAVGVKP